MKPSILKFHFRNTFTKIYTPVAALILFQLIKSMFFSDEPIIPSDYIFFVLGLLIIIAGNVLLIRETIQDYKKQYPS